MHAEVLISPGPQDRLRALVVIPIIFGILFAILLVLVFISESSGGEVMGEGGETTCFLSGLSNSPSFFFFSLEKVAKKPTNKVGHP